jgi:hypothetical protein
MIAERESPYAGDSHWVKPDSVRAVVGDSCQSRHVGLTTQLESQLSLNHNVWLTLGCVVMPVSLNLLCPRQNRWVPPQKLADSGVD